MPQTSEILATRNSKPKVVACIPCHNTASLIGDIVSSARKYVDQVIVIDDGSDDSTTEVAKVVGALVVNHDQNRGYGEAIKSCFEAAKANTADVLIILDGDGQHNPKNSPKVLAPVLRGEADLVIGSRFLQSKESIVDTQRSTITPLNSRLMTLDSRPTIIPRYRKFGISVITFLYNFGSKTKVSDAQSGFRAYSKKVVESFNLTEKGMSISIETLVQARRKGFVIKEVPITCFYTPSTLNLRAIKHGLAVALAIARIRFKSLFNRFTRER